VNAFYDALVNNKSAEELMGEEVLVKIAREKLQKNLRKNVTVDWSVRESVRARLRLISKKSSKKYKYPPDEEKKQLI
jgi:type I restriction enzyme R subunit